jgi:hypothetical protein
MESVGDSDFPKKIEIQTQMIEKQREISKGLSDDLFNMSFNIKDADKTTEDYKETQQKLSDALSESDKKVAKLDNTLRDFSETAKEQAKDAIESYVNHLKDKVDDRIESINTEKETFVDAKNTEIEAIEKKIDALDKENEAIDEQIKKTELLDNLAKAKEKVSNVEKEKNARIFQDGKFVWSVNPNDLREAKEELSNVEKDYTEWDRENNLKHQKQTLQDEINAKQELIRTKELWAKTEQDKLKLQLTQLDEITKKSNDNQIISYEQLMTTLEKLGVKAEVELGRVKTVQAALGGMGVNVDSGSSSNNNSSTVPKSETVHNGVDIGEYKGVDSRGNDTRLALMGLDSGGYTGDNVPSSGAVALLHAKERILSPSQTQAFELLVNRLPNITNVFDRVFSGTNPTVPNFNRNTSSTTSTDNSVNIENVTVVANDVTSMLSQLKRNIRSR